ncbi:hypothetical protein M0R04_10075 [Candidatus Dojkabacteria bacterium]|jgi:hypothetical protein|nr:hypothetical protein [Candidatus Dojkabacteria bacterium]
MKSLKALIKQNKLDWVNDNITEKNFPLNKNWKESEYKLYHFDKYISSEDVIEEMNKDGYEPATLQDMLNWKDWNGKDWVVALGQMWLDSFSSRYVSVLFFDGGKRRLGLTWFDLDWDDVCQFLAVRKLDIGTQTLSSFSPLDIKFKVAGKNYKVVEDK